ncbi:hypothetical protein HT136_12400 [Novosphingobium profundi]|uniref:CmcJ/NvfI family oxidoreductase n=1 Tax=Novosphingobium profundi TaxID=1774954 RepID=UPI001BD96253|nr:hypothetical protein [Novosphingobium profundi]
MNATALARARTIDAKIGYLHRSSKINRRFCAPHEDVNTSEYIECPVHMQDGSGLEDQFQLDVHGFMFVHSPNTFTAWNDPERIAADYEPVQLEIVRRILGADRMVNLGHALRTAGNSVEKAMKPVASEAHVDFESRAAQAYAKSLYAEHHPDAPPYERFVAFSFWRPLTPPAHDWPLALCDFRSLAPDEGKRNVLVWCDEIPPKETWFDPIEGEDAFPAAYIFDHNPAHRWWYFSRMTPQDALLLKFHDSDHSRAWRCAHSAFRNTADDQPTERESIEFRGMAFFDAPSAGAKA